MSSANGRPDILTVSGNYFDFLSPDNNVYGINDIAHALSHLCRFAGHTRSFYSVAQHCVLVSQLVHPRFALNGLLHDSAEAFLVDIPRPLKQLLSDYKAIERRVERSVLARFRLPYPMPNAVHIADRQALIIEQRDLMPPHDDTWAVLEGVNTDFTGTIAPLDPLSARALFLDRYWALHG